MYMGEHYHPVNAGRVIAVRSKLNKSVEGYCCPEVYRLETFWHLGVPTQNNTLCILTNEANRLRHACCEVSPSGP
jgi:hypothetical protein